MKFTNQLVDVLRNFSTINQSILFKPGKIVSTVSPLKTILANATVDVEIEKEFAIYDLHEFLAIVSLMPNCDVSFTAHQIVLGTKQKKIKYTFAHPSTIVASQYNSIELQSNDIITTFDLPYSEISNLNKISAIWKSDTITIEGEDGNVVIKAGNTKDPSSSNYVFEVENVQKPFTQRFSLSLKIESLRVLNKNYTVVIPNKKLIQMTDVDQSVTYWIATDK